MTDITRSLGNRTVVNNRRSCCVDRIRSEGEGRAGVNLKRSGNALIAREGRSTAGSDRDVVDRMVVRVKILIDTIEGERVIRR